MLRYRGYDWALVHGESRIEVNLWPTGGGKPMPVWRLVLQYTAVGPEWRRCGNLDRPHVQLELTGFDVPPGDWRKLSEVDFWNDEEPDDWLSDDYRSPGDLGFQFVSSYRANREQEDVEYRYFNWRVVRADGPLITIELSADPDPQDMPPESMDTVSAIPGQATVPEAAAGPHEVYLLETVPFGVVITTVPRNAPDACAHAGELARRLLKTPAADHMKLSDFKDSKHEHMRGDLHVELHYFGYHGT